MRVLLGYDGSDRAEAARELTAHLRLPSGTAIAVVAVIESGAEILAAPDVPALPADAPEHDAWLIRELELSLWNAAVSLRAPDRSCSTRVLHGRPASALIDEAQRWNADLVIVGNRGHGPFESLLLGSVSAEVVDHAPCPVLVARHAGAHRILLGVDGSQSAERAIEMLAAWPILHGLPVSVVAVVEPMQTWPLAVSGAFAPTAAEIGIESPTERQLQLEAVVASAVDRLRRAGMIAEGEVRAGDPADQLARAARHHSADLIVVGTRGLSVVQRLVLGSVARKVLLHTEASVLVVRPAKERVTSKERVPALATA